VARAKQTARAEARRRYRQAASAGTDEETQEAGEDEEAATSTSRGASASRDRSKAKPAQPSGRPGFGTAFRESYHPVNLREDLRLLPSLLRSWAFLGSAGLVVAGALVYIVFPNYDGGLLAWQMLVLPNSALAPQLIAGFFAPRASYLLGLLVGLLEGVLFLGIISVFSAQVGSPVPTDQLGPLLFFSFISGPVSGMLFAAAAAWYRRFLALTSRRQPQGKSARSSQRSGRR
jgi:hypothetical protein